MSVWQVVQNDTYTGLECKYTPHCYYCKGNKGMDIKMESSCIKLLHFPLNEPAYFERGEVNGYAIDVEVECPVCGYWEVFGVAVEKEHWKKLQAQTEKLLAETQND